MDYSHHPSHADWRRRSLKTSSGPANLMALTTGRCNYACPMCHHSILEEVPVSLTAENMEPFLSRAASLYFAGGEPLFLSGSANPAGSAIFQSLMKDHPKVRLNAYTNGSLLNEKMASIVLERFDHVHFGMESADPAVYKSVRSKPTLKVVLKNMARLGRMKRERGLSPLMPPVISVNSVVTNRTVEGLPDLIEAAAQRGAGMHVLLTLQSHMSANVRSLLAQEHGPDGARKVEDEYHAQLWPQALNPAVFPPGRLDEVRERLRAVYKKYNIWVEDQLNLLGIPGVKPPPPAEFEVCPGPWNMGFILENGNVTPCCSNATVMGNLREQGFDEIWNGPCAQDLRRSFISGEMDGCWAPSCPSQYDYFRVGPKSRRRRLWDWLGGNGSAPDAVRSVLFLRTAPDFASHIAAKTVAEFYPAARMTVVTNQAGEAECRRWLAPNAEVAVYPRDAIEPAPFAQWWNGRAPFDLAVFAYNNNEQRGYEGVEEAVRRVGAARAIGVTLEGEVNEL